MKAIDVAGLMSPAVRTTIRVHAKQRLTGSTVVRHHGLHLGVRLYVPKIPYRFEFW